MRALAIIALALLLAGCNGDRMKQDTNARQVQLQSWCFSAPTTRCSSSPPVQLKSIRFCIGLINNLKIT